MKAKRRLDRELKTVGVMISMYCGDLHGGSAGNLCLGCSAAYDYAAKRIAACPFRDDKPTCLNCPVHCFRPDRRELVRRIMRYSGPRMLFRHPFLAVMHLVDGATGGKAIRGRAAADKVM